MKIKKVSKVNPVAKHSKHKSGAGAHLTKKDYDRKIPDPMSQEEIDNWFKYAEDDRDEASELIALLKARQEICNNANEWFRLEEEIVELNIGRPILSVADLKKITQSK